MVLSCVLYLIFGENSLRISIVVIIIVGFILFPLLEKIIIKNGVKVKGKVIDIIVSEFDNSEARIFVEFLFNNETFFISQKVNNIIYPKINESVTVVINEDNILDSFFVI